MQTLRNIRSLLKETYDEWHKQKPEILGAALAFYIIFSLGPVLVITTGIVDFLLGGNTAESEIVQQIHTLIGPKPADVIRSLIAEAYAPPAKYLTTIISIPLIVFGSGMIFFQLRNTLFIVWGIPRRRSRKIIGFLKSYAISFSLVMVLGAILFFLIAKSIALAMLDDFIIQYISVPFSLLRTADSIATFGIVTVLFALVYKILLHEHVTWPNAWVGALGTSFLFTVGQVCIGLYLSMTDIDTAYGALGSVTVLVIWIFYSAQIFLVGAVFTRVHGKRGAGRG